ncbi:citrate synthase family protein [Paraburkholderia sediminicola]|uniref:citrate synthase family protein n=1 Tax=Paraburkholderia sediminicola TaxID=458836 RepID=UPI0038BADBF9
MMMINLVHSINMAEKIERPTPEHAAADAPSKKALADYATAAEAMKILNVRQQTLYAYVSRGLIRSISQPGHKGRLYWRDDLKRLEARSLARHGHGAVAASAMNFGEPIIPTSITEITPDGPRYRGRLAVDLARARAPFEAVAQLLWTGILNDGVAIWKKAKPWPELNRLIESSWSLRHGSLLDMFSLVTLYIGGSKQSAMERMDDGHMFNAGRQIIQTMVGCCGLVSEQNRYQPMGNNQTVSEGILAALSIEPTSENREGIEALLILLADHELSPSTFAVRVSASTGCTLHSCIVSGICASTGTLTGELYDRVDEFFDSASTVTALVRRATALHERGMAIPGFGHPLYPRGDPRARYMIELAKRRADQPRQMTAIYRFIEEMGGLHGLLPRQELGTVVLTRAIGLPKHTAGALAALARVAGWLAHVQEQRMFGTVLRPRARFVGSPAGSAI